MLRLAIVSTVIPLALAGGVARDWTSASASQCFGHEAIPGIARTIAFTDDPARATVRVQLVQGPELADLAIAEDSTATEAGGCGIRETLRAITIGARPVPGEPIVYLSRNEGADYRIYVDSAHISPREAAALIVSARGGHTQLAAKPFDHEPTGSIRR
jgi:hypothetical protein